MVDPYSEREQTLTKHFLLRSYLQTLVYKLFHGGQKSITFVDGFSGPWKSQTEDFADSSFMIAINVLRAAHFQMREIGKPKTTKCFFVEKNAKSYTLLKQAVERFHSPNDDFHIQTYHGEFESAADRIVEYVGQSFALVFIDPTGWTGYTYSAIGPILKHEPGEVLINFMFDFVNRAAGMSDPKTIKSLDAIFGGTGWKSRIQAGAPVGTELERIFREVLREAGNYKYVLSTRIDKATADRPHFCIAYGTRAVAGLKAFREVEHNALKGHQELRVRAKQTKREVRTQQVELFSPELISDTSFAVLVSVEKQAAKAWIQELLRARGRPIQFGVLVPAVLERFIVRETVAKDICVELAEAAIIKNTWKAAGKKKPLDSSTIELL
jgi:three-Cys-motif partner protein